MEKVNNETTETPELTNQLALNLFESLHSIAIDTRRHLTENALEILGEVTENVHFIDFIRECDKKNVNFINTQLSNLKNISTLVDAVRYSHIKRIEANHAISQQYIALSDVLKLAFKHVIYITCHEAILISLDPSQYPNQNLSHEAKENAEKLLNEFKSRISQLISNYNNKQQSSKQPNVQDGQSTSTLMNKQNTIVVIRACNPNSYFNPHHALCAYLNSEVGTVIYPTNSYYHLNKNAPLIPLTESDSVKYSLGTLPYNGGVTEVAGRHCIIPKKSDFKHYTAVLPLKDKSGLYSSFPEVGPDMLPRLNDDSLLKEKAEIALHEALLNLAPWLLFIR